MAKKVTQLPASTDISSDDVILASDVAAGVSEKVSMGALGLVDNSAGFRVRDDFNPGVTFATYVDSQGAFSVHADNVSDEAGEGFGVRRLETAVVSARDSGAMFSGGLTNLIVRVRFRVVSDPVDIGIVGVGVLQAGGVGFAIFAGRGSNGFVAASLSSIAGGGSGLEIESAITLVQSVWYEVEIRIDFAALEVDLFVDGAAAVLGTDATTDIPEETEDMSPGYVIAPASGTGIVEIDYIEVTGKRR